MTSLATGFLRTLLVRALAALPDETSSTPRPPARSITHASGPRPMRLLLFGGGAAVGYGVGTHDLALAGHLARNLARATSRGIDLEVIAEPNLTTADAVARAGLIDPLRYDAIIVAVGVQDAVALRNQHGWASDMESLLGVLGANDPESGLVFVLGIPQPSAVLTLPRISRDLVDHHAELLDVQLRELVGRFGAVRHVPFVPTRSADVARYRESSDYRQMARRIVTSIGPELTTRGSGRRIVSDEAARQRAVEALAVLDTPAEDRFDRITLTAQQLMHSTGAAISFIDGDRQWFKSTVGLHTVEIARTNSICDHAIRYSGGLMVADLKQDDRFQGNSLLTEVAGIRSYAGYPIHSIDGHAVGAICVYDSQPREFTAAEMAFLADLAHFVEDQLVSSPSA